jgi:hypothetical protein
VVFQEVMTRFREVRDFRAPRGAASFSAISCA